MQTTLRAVYIILIILLSNCAGPSKDIKSELSQEKTKPFTLTAEEKQWLAEHPNINLAPDPEFIPIEYFDKNGNYKGVAADYVALVEKKLGIKFNILHLKNWEEVLDQTKTGSVDMWGAAAVTSQRLQYMLFTKPYIEIPAGIFVTNTVEGSIELSHLDGKKVSIPLGYGMQDYLETHHPKIDLDLVHDISTGLHRVSSGKSEAFIANVVLASFYIEKEGIKNLRIANKPGINYEWGFATRKDWPMLNRILQKTIDAIETDE